MSRKSLFQCPVCSKALAQSEKQYFCRSGHSFDIARNGYVNLLLQKHTGSGDPGDSKEMILSRRDFLNRGYYESFSNRINDIFTASISVDDRKGPICILDAGCGEGYYTSRLKKALAEHNGAGHDVIGRDIVGHDGAGHYGAGYADIYGTDVSKAAVHYASSRDKDIRFAAASTYHLPILSGTMDYILCLFAPRDEEQFRRVLKKSGKLIVAAPGPRHLFSFKTALYGNPDYIGQKGTVGEGFKLAETANVSYNIHLKCAADIANLLMMTPYTRHTDQQTAESLNQLEELETEVDFNIFVYDVI